MAVLKLEPTKAPNFSSTSQILARAGLTLDRGFESAQGLLGAYQDGKQEQVDNEVFAEVQGFTTAEELQKYFNEGGLKGRGISKDMRDRLGKLGADIAGLNSTRANTATTLGKEGRDVKVFDQGQRKRDAQIANALLVLNNDRAARGEPPVDISGRVVTTAPASGPIPSVVNPSDTPVTSGSPSSLSADVRDRLLREAVEERELFTEVINPDDVTQEQSDAFLSDYLKKRALINPDDVTQEQSDAFLSDYLKKRRGTPVADRDRALINPEGPTPPNGVVGTGDPRQIDRQALAGSGFDTTDTSTPRGPNSGVSTEGFGGNLGFTAIPRGVPTNDSTATAPAATAIQQAIAADPATAPAVATGEGLPNYTPRNQVEADFMGAVGARIKNPYSLAVIAGTGERESGFDPANANREWPDGKSIAGGIMSWNGPRLQAMKDFVGDDKSPAAQAAFFLQENPELIRKLENSGSIEESQELMDNAWAYDGYNRPGDKEKIARFAASQRIYNSGIGGAQTNSTGAATPGSASATLAAAVPGAAASTSIVDQGPASAAISDAVEVPQAVATIPTVSQPAPVSARDQLAARRIEQGVFTGADLVASEARSRVATEETRVQTAAVRARGVSEIISQMTLDAANNPNTYNPETALKTMRDSEAFKALTAGEKVAAITQATDNLTGILNPQLAPSTIADPDVAASSKLEVERDEQTLAAMPQSDLFSLSKQFKSTGDVTQALTDYLSLGNDGETPKGSFWVYDFDKNTLTNMIARIAKSSDPQVTIERAAAAMVKIFERDPIGYNTLGRRFNEYEAVDYINEHLNDDAVKRYDRAVTKFDRRSNEIVSITLRLGRLRTKHAKLSPGSEKDQVAEEIEVLRNILRSGNTVRESQEALAEYIGPKAAGILKSQEPGSEFHSATMTLIRKTIETDPSLSADEKKAMLSQL